MDIKIDIDAAAVQAQVTAAIVNSAIGEEIAKAVSKMLTTNSSYGYNSKTLVEQAVLDAARRIIGSEVTDALSKKRDLIAAQVAEKLTDEVLGDFVNKAWRAVESALKD